VCCRSVIGGETVLFLAFSSKRETKQNITGRHKRRIMSGSSKEQTMVGLFNVM
jgi:hypothetical protein